MSLALLDGPEPPLGHHFVANYPPFSVWKPGCQQQVQQACARPGQQPLGLYLHIPFCRKRCHFCYFRVFTGQEAAKVARYCRALLSELDLYRELPLFCGRAWDFVYFGGGTPSYLSTQQLEELFSGVRARIGWKEQAEIAFECEPGTVTEAKLKVLRELGVTRLSMGFESMTEEVLEASGRAHRCGDILKAFAAARRQGFSQINVDLIAGLPGESLDSWQAGVLELAALGPDSVTIYPLELPRNTGLHRDAQEGREDLLDWAGKRDWCSRAFTLLREHGYAQSSAYTTARPGARFGYRDMLWRGADMLGLGTSSFSHLEGTHFQNLAQLDAYLEAVEAGQPPLWRGYSMSAEEALVRQLVLQLKLGQVDLEPLRTRFGVDPLERFARPLALLQERQMLRVEEQRLVLSAPALGRVDRWLPLFFLPEHQEVAYA